MVEYTGREVLLKDENGEVIIPYVNVDITSKIDALMNNIYPVGSIYIGTQSVCPMSALITGSVWELIEGDRVLQSSSSSHLAGSTIEAGLPNITGNFNHNRHSLVSPTGAFTKSGSQTGYNGSYNGTSCGLTMDFDASLSNPIYGKSSTVQPPAYVVNIWRRTA